jgi:phage shock protein PspC (stress-responsive transcriptional regulator)
MYPMVRRCGVVEHGAMTTEQPHSTFDQAPPLAARRPLRRSPDRVIGGVASGLGDYLNVDPILIRAVFAGLMVFGGSGLALYILGWLLIPAADQPQSILEGWIRGAGSRFGWLGVGVVALIVIWAFSAEGINLETGQRWTYIPPEAILAIAIVIGGYLLLRQRGDHHATGPVATSAMAPGMAADAAAAPDAAASPTLAATAPSSLAASPAWAPAPYVAPAYAPYTPRPAAPRSPLGWYILAATFLAVGVAGLIDTGTTLTVEPGQYFGIGLLVLGLGLVVGAWWGRARLLILLGLLVIPMAWTAAFLRVPLEGPWGDLGYRPTSVAEVQPVYRLAGGELYLDLSQLAREPGPIDIEASVAAGEITVIVPARSDLVVDARVEGGRLVVLDRPQHGTGLTDHVEDQGVPGGPTIHLNLAGGIADIEVRRLSLEGN